MPKRILPNISKAVIIPDKSAKINVTKLGSVIATPAVDYERLTSKPTEKSDNAASVNTRRALIDAKTFTGKLNVVVIPRGHTENKPKPPEDTTPLPVLHGDPGLLVFDDRFDTNRQWYLSGVACIDPETPFFTLYKPDSKVERYGVEIKIRYNDDVAPEGVGHASGETSFARIEANITNAWLKIAYYDSGPSGRTLKYFPDVVCEQIDIEHKLLTFKIVEKDDNDSIVRWVYQNLSDYNTAEICDARLVIERRFEGWEQISKRKEMPRGSMVNVTHYTQLHKLDVAFDNPLYQHAKVQSMPLLIKALPQYQPNQATNPKKKLGKLVKRKAEGQVDWHRKENVVRSECQLKVPCGTGNGTLYEYLEHLAEGEHRIPLGCQPPWQGAYAPEVLYRKLTGGLGDWISDENLSQHVAGLVSKVAIYQEIRDPKTFVVIPLEYRLALDDRDEDTPDADTYNPCIDLTTLTNPNPGHEMENLVLLSMLLKSALTKFDVALLTVLLKRLLGQQPNILTPFAAGIPTDFPENSDEFDIVPMPSGFVVAFKSKEGKFPQSLVLLASIRRDDGGSAIGKSISIHYQIDKASQQQSRIHIDMRHTVGDVMTMDTSTSLAELLLHNHSPHKAEIQGFLTFGSTDETIQYIHLKDKAVSTVPGESTLRLREIFSDETLLQHERGELEIVPRYQLTLDDVAWEESRVQMDLRQTIFPISATEINARNNGITRINVYVLFSPEMGSLRFNKELFPDETGKFLSDENPIRLTHPVNLNVDYKSFQYQITIYYRDNKIEIKEWQEGNFGDNTKLNLTAAIFDLPPAADDMPES